MKDNVLICLKVEEEVAYAAKQHAYSLWHEAKQKLHLAYEKMQTTWATRCEAKKNMQDEFAVLQENIDNYRSVWADYTRIREYLLPRINDLSEESNQEHSSMIYYYEMAEYEFKHGEKNLAIKHRNEAKRHKAFRDEINSKIGELSSELSDAKQNAEWLAGRYDDSAYKNAKAAYEEAEAKHTEAKAEYEELKKERDELKENFDKKNEIFKSKRTDKFNRIEYLKKS